jgi:integrase
MVRERVRRRRSRANGEGTIYQRNDGRWAGAWVDGNGKRRTWYGKTRSEVEKRLRQERDNHDKGLPILDSVLDTCQCFREWLEASRRRVPPSTWKKYTSLLTNHVIPYVGKVQFKKLSAQHLNRLYDGASERGLSDSSVATLHVVLHRALEDAKRKHLVHRNVADEADPYRAARPEMRTLTQAQALQLLEAARGHELEALFVLALTTGMRQGELLGLRWKDVDLRAGVVRVTGTLQRGKGAVVAEPKTAQSRRSIWLTDAGRRALLLQQENVPADCEWVFPNRAGHPWNARNLVRRAFEPLLEIARLPRIRFHDLRHTFCTLMLELGVNPKVVSEMAGHAGVAITLDLYSHASPGIHQQATHLLDQALSSEGPLNLVPSPSDQQALLPVAP